MKTWFSGLVGDVGGANARLALVDGLGHICPPRVYCVVERGVTMFEDVA